jgi:diguanylate cyclase (GGDEF)-like protein
MSGAEWLKTQRLIAWARWIAFAFGILQTFAITDNPGAPGPISRPALLAMTLVQGSYNTLAFLGLRRIRARSRTAAERLVGALVVGDFIVCAGWVLILSNNHYNTGFALFCLIAIEVAVNYPRRLLVAGLFLVGYFAVLMASRTVGLHYGFKLHYDELSFRFFIVAIVAGLTTVIVQDREKVRALAEERSRTDALTGLGNRRALDERLGEEIVRAERFGYPLTVLLADVDHFKTYNDTHGHRAGDEILRTVGRVLQSQALRQGTDHAYRYGGEEFLVLLPGTKGNDALDVAERLRAAIEGETATIRVPRGAAPVTVSVGLAVYPTDGTSGDEVVQRADIALYRAKETRNRAVAYAPDGTIPPATHRDSPRAAATG